MFEIIPIGFSNVLHRKIVIGYPSRTPLRSGKIGGVVRTDLYAQNFRVTAAIGRHVDRRVKAALGGAAGVVNGTVVRLRDVNGTRGGVDKACRVVVGTRGRGAVAVEAVDRDLYAAIDAAAAKLRTALRRRLKRRQRPRRGHALLRTRQVAA
jgi:ribosome-associated translation inhibitor RaiA